MPIHNFDMYSAGLMVRERNWLDVYPYTSWGGNDSLPPLQEGQQFMPADLLLKQVMQLLMAPTR